MTNSGTRNHLAEELYVAPVSRGRIRTGSREGALSPASERERGLAADELQALTTLWGYQHSRDDDE